MDGITEIPKEGLEVSIQENESNIKELERMLEVVESVNLVNHILQKDTAIYPSYEDGKKLLTGKELLDEMGRVVVEEFKIDLESRKQWDENTADNFKLFSSFMETKTVPWENCSNVSLPLLATACLQFHARAYDALLPAKKAVQIVNTGDEDADRAMRVGKYMNFQVYHDMPGFEEGMDKTLLQLPLFGCVVRKTFYDIDLAKVVSYHVPISDFVVNYGARSLADAQRTSHVFYPYKNDIMKKVLSGAYSENAKDLSWDSTYQTVGLPDSSLKTMVDKSTGIFDARIKKLPRIFIEQHRLWDINGDGIEEPVVITVDLIDEKVVRITERSYFDEMGKVQTIEHFTKYSFIPNPEGFYDLGFGTLIRGLNEAANTIVNEVIDAGSLANLQGGFIAKRSGLRKGDVKLKMGVFQEVDMHLEDLSKAIYKFDFRGPNQTLYAVLGLLYEYSKLVSSISETMTGQLPASDTPASSVLALIEEGRKVFSSIHKRIHRGFKEELKKIYRLNGIYLNEKIYFKTLGDNNVPQGDAVVTGRSDFKGTLDVIPVSDPNITSTAEKVMKAEQALKNVVEFDSQNGAAIYEARKRYLEALEVPDVDKLLQPPPEPPDLPQEEENAMMITERPAPVLPNQDHLHHLTILEDLISGAVSKTITPAAKRLVEKHRQEHIAGHYLQTKKGGMA